MTTKTLTIEGRTLCYEEVGEGRPVLLLHGFPFSRESFWPQLEAPPPGCRLLVPDHRGFGRSGLVPGPATMEALAGDAVALLDALSIGRATVGGVSMGGYAALALTRTHPERVERLILLDTQATADDEAGRARREFVAMEAETKGMGPIVEAMLPRLFAKGSRAEDVGRIEAIMRATNPLAAAAASRGMGLRSDASDVLAHFRGPCLIVVGAEDVLTPVDRSRRMAQLTKNARLEVISGAGHLANIEQPEQVNSLIAEFLSTPATGDGGR